MSFFDYFRNQAPKSTEANTNTGDEQPAVLYVTPGNEVEIPAAEAKASTVGQLFLRYAEALGIDPTQVSRYTDQGQVVTANTPAIPGRIYQGSADSFVKG